MSDQPTEEQIVGAATMALANFFKYLAEYQRFALFLEQNHPESYKEHLDYVFELIDTMQASDPKLIEATKEIIKLRPDSDG